MLLVAVVAVAVRAAEGDQLWAFNLNRAFTASTPAISADGQTIYIGAKLAQSGRVIAVDPRGNLKWTVKPKDLPDWVDSSPTLAPDGQTLFVGCADGKLYAIDANTGVVSWSFDTQSPGIFSSPALSADGDTIYIGSGANALHAVSATTHQEKWRYTTGDFVDSTPAVGVDGVVYFGSYDRSVYAVNPNGSLKWQFSTGGVVLSSPAIAADGTIFIGSRDQRVYAINPDGSKKWDHLTNGPVDTSPVLGADGTVYVGSADNNFYALDPADGSVRWARNVQATGQSTAAVRADGTIIFSTNDGKVHALNRDGTPAWTLSTGLYNDDLFESSPAIAPDGTIYVGMLDGYLLAIAGNGSPGSAYSNWPMFRRDIAHRGRVEPLGVGARLVNLSTRAQVGGGANLIAGFALSGGGTRVFLVRAAGPALAGFHIPNPLPDPTLALIDQISRTTVAQNDNWEQQSANTAGFTISGTAAGVGAFPFAPGSKDSALVLPLNPGAYTALVDSADGATGIALVETYNTPAGDTATHLINLSTRGRVGLGDSVLIGGLAVTGTGPMRLLVRGIGPGLVQFGVPNVLARPQIVLFNTSGTELAGTRNAGWASGTARLFRGDTAGAAATVGAFPLDENAADAATIVTVLPGSYTVQVAGVGDTTGEALVEVYLLH